MMVLESQVKTNGKKKERIEIDKKRTQESQKRYTSFNGDENCYFDGKARVLIVFIQKR